MLQRLRTDFQLAIITLFGACAIVGIVPFAVYRFVSGAPDVGILDTLLLVSISTAVGYAWRTGDTKRTGLVLVVIYTSGAIVSAAVLGVVGLFWMYAAILSNFFLVGRRQAVAATAVALVVLAVHGQAFESSAHMLSFLTTSALVGLLAFILAYRTEIQRFQLEALATRDPLTGAHNRRAMEQELQIAVEAYRRGRSTFGLIMLDLDHFKRINDQFGHDAGDRVLIAFADLIRQSTRKMDRFFRFGGEEFVLLVPGVNVAGLHTITGNLRRQVAERLHGPGGMVTVSFGAAALKSDEDWQSWLGRADAALYRAKSGGRDQAVIDSEDGADSAVANPCPR